MPQIIRLIRPVLAASLVCACASRHKDMAEPQVAPAPLAPLVSAPAPEREDSAGLQAASEQDLANLTHAADAAFGPLYFAFNSDALQPESRERLVEVADFLRQHRQVTVTITGHCDERGTPEYNLALGDRRARAARDYLTRMGVAGERVHTVSYGSERPAVVGAGESVWAKNRRAEFQVAGIQAGSAEPPAMSD